MPQGVEESNYIKKRRAAESEQRERQHHEDNVQIVSALNRIADELVATEQQDQADDDKRSSREKLTILLLFLTVFATGIADIIFFVTMQDARTAATNQYGAMTTQQGIMGGQLAEMEIARRPWVTADFSIVSPILFNNGSVTMTFKAIARNIGQTPATQIAMSIEGFPIIPGPNVQAKTLHSCDAAGRMINLGAPFGGPSSRATRRLAFILSRLQKHELTSIGVNSRL